MPAETVAEWRMARTRPRDGPLSGRRRGVLEQSPRVDRGLVLQTHEQARRSRVTCEHVPLPVGNIIPAANLDQSRMPFLILEQRDRGPEVMLDLVIGPPVQKIVHVTSG